MRLPIPMRLPSGQWWLVHDDLISNKIFSDAFELEEAQLVMRLLAPGMVVFDIGAHAGFYTLLASRRVGLSGRVIAFEPSPREFRRLRTHTRMNRCLNVVLEPQALGLESKVQTLFVVRGRETGCNSLRVPDVREPVEEVTVPQTTLDEYLKRNPISRVDFVKLDVEGAELEVLEGGKTFFSSNRPIVLSEIADRRTRPWGYEAHRILHFLSNLGYRWFVPDLHLSPFVASGGPLNNNLVAIPAEREPEVRSSLSN